MERTTYNRRAWRNLPRTKQRFIALTELSADGCWLWRKPNNLGYGQFWINGTNRVAHRWSYENFVGPIPEGRVITHVCGHNACVNPDHLAAVTRREAHIRDTCGNGHAMDEANTYVSPDGGRHCRECRNTLSRKRRAEGKGRPEGWTATRKRVLERDNYTCAVGFLFGIADECTETLDVHHREPRSEGGSDDDDNLYVLCRRHHMIIEGVGRRMRKERVWRACGHNHRYEHARRECERKLNRL